MEHNSKLAYKHILFFFFFFSSPLGELFDHGLDSSAAFLIPISLFSLFGHGPHSVTLWELYRLMLSCLAGFYMAHWEKYNTGTLFLPWTYDASQIVSSLRIICYLPRKTAGPKTWLCTFFTSYHVHDAVAQWTPDQAIWFLALDDTTRSKSVKCAWKACETHVKNWSCVKHTCEIKLHQDLVSFTCVWNSMWNIIRCVKLKGKLSISCWACETACEKKELCETYMWNKKYIKILLVSHVCVGTA